MNEIKKFVRGAAASSLAVVIFLIMLATDAGKVKRSDVASIILGIAILVLAYCAIMQWIKCVRKYVDLVIGQKINDAVTKK